MHSQIEKKIITYSKRISKKLSDISIISAYSSGVDSTTLSYILSLLKIKYNFKLELIHFNHNFHKHSSKMESNCINFSKINNLKLYVKNLHFVEKDNFESKARNKRYAYLRSRANQINADFIFTAHHKDDQIETLYMKKIENADWISRIGIREYYDIIRRPMLNISKINIIKYAKNNNLIWINDPTNDNNKFKRNFIRNNILSKKQFVNQSVIFNLLLDSSKFDKKLKSTIDFFKKNNKEIIDSFSDYYIKINTGMINNIEIEQLKIFVYFIIKTYFKSELKRFTRNFWKELFFFIKTALPGKKFIIDDYAFIIEKSNNKIILIKNKIFNDTQKNKLNFNQNWYNSYFTVDNFNYLNSQPSKYKLLLNKKLAEEGIYIRRWKKGDRIYLNSRRKNKLVSDLLNENKLSVLQKLIQPIIVNKSDDIIWIPGIINISVENTCQNNELNLISWHKK